MGCRQMKKRGGFVFRKVSFKVSRSSHQTQTGDLGGQEGVEDEDDGLRTRVEVQLLQGEAETGT